MHPEEMRKYLIEYTQCVTENAVQARTSIDSEMILMKNS